MERAWMRPVTQKDQAMIRSWEFFIPLPTLWRGRRAENRVNDQPHHPDEASVKSPKHSGFQELLGWRKCGDARKNGMSKQGMKSSTSPISCLYPMHIFHLCVHLYLFITFSHKKLTSVSQCFPWVPWVSSKLIKPKDCTRACLMVETVKNLPAMQELQET